MAIRPAAAVLLLGCSLTASFSWVSNALATQAATTDLTDFIVRLGGWFLDADSKNDTADHYWAQVSYTLQSAASGSKPAATGSSSTTNTSANATAATGPGATGAASNSSASGSNITTLVMTRTMLQAEAATGGGVATAPSSGSGPWTVPPPCTNGMTTTETVTLDLRELTTTSAITPGTETIDEGTNGKFTINVYKVNLTMNDNMNFIRVSAVTSPPNCTQGGQPVPLPGGQSVNATTSQKDVSTYPIEFADQHQAEYFRMLINSVVPTLSPPRPNPAALGP
jgi:hypothetical protein